MFNKNEYWISSFLSQDSNTDDSTGGRSFIHLLASFSFPSHQSLKRKWLSRPFITELIEKLKVWICSKEAALPSADNLSHHNSHWISFEKWNQDESQKTFSTGGSFIPLPLISSQDLITGWRRTKNFSNVQTLMIQMTVKKIWCWTDLTGKHHFNPSQHHKVKMSFYRSAALTWNQVLKDAAFDYSHRGHMFGIRGQRGRDGWPTTVWSSVYSYRAIN